MAIYHFTAHIISRARAQSSVAAAAYRRAAKLHDERTQRTHDYTRKKNVIHSEILIPKDAPQWITDIDEMQKFNPHAAAEQLWNSVEAKENRKDSELAREIECALPLELDKAAWLTLTREFIEEQFTTLGMVADFSIHAEPNNPHVHIMLSTRTLEAGGWGQKVLGWRNRALLHTWRERWAAKVNLFLAQAKVEVRIDHRSYAAQGIALIPTQHEGRARHLWNKGLENERHTENEAIHTENLKAIATTPTLLLDKIANTRDTFGINQVIDACKTYFNHASPEAEIAANAEQFNGISDSNIAKLLDEITEHESVFKESAIYKILQRSIHNADDVLSALAAVKTSTALLAIGPGEDGRERYTTQRFLDLEAGIMSVATQFDGHFTKINDGQLGSLLTRR